MYNNISPPLPNTEASHKISAGFVVMVPTISYNLGIGLSVTIHNFFI